MRIDLQLCSAAAWKRGDISSCEVLRFGSSDHWPTTLTYKPGIPDEDTGESDRVAHQTGDHDALCAAPLLTDYADCADGVFKATAASLLRDAPTVASTAHAACRDVKCHEREEGEGEPTRPTSAAVRPQSDDDYIEDDYAAGLCAEESAWTPLRHYCPTVAVLMDGRSVLALADTGATYSLMTSACSKAVRAKRVHVHDSQKQIGRAHV